MIPEAAIRIGIEPMSRSGQHYLFADLGQSMHYWPIIEQLSDVVLDSYLNPQQNQLNGLIPLLARISGASVVSRQRVHDQLCVVAYDPLQPERGQHFVGWQLWNALTAELINRQKPLDNQAFSMATNQLITHTPFLIKAAMEADAAYKRQNPTNQDFSELFTQPEIDLLLSGDSAHPDYRSIHEKLAINLAGLYALVDGISTVTQLSNTNMMKLLINISQNKLSRGLKDLLCRFAHSTWASGQPFRHRETRKSIMMFDTLEQEEREKDWVQIQAMSEAVMSYLAWSNR